MEKTQKREAEISTYKVAQLFKNLFDVLRASMVMTPGLLLPIPKTVAPISPTEGQRSERKVLASLWSAAAAHN